MKRKVFVVRSIICCILLLLTLSGCQLTILGSTISYQLWHDIPVAEAVCVGGLKGKLSSGTTVMFESPVVPLGEDYDENIGLVK